MRFSLRKDIFNHKDICCFFFVNNSDIFLMINVYSDNHQSALKYLKDTEANIHNVLVITRDFNIRNSIWDPSYTFHSVYSDNLFDIVNLFDFKLSCPIQQVLTCYFNNANDSNSVIDLIFFFLTSIEIDNYGITPKLWYLSDHALLTIDISIAEEFIQNKHQTNIRNSKEEQSFISELIEAIGNIDISNILNKDLLEFIVQ